MTICKAVFSGTVLRNPEKRSTTNNVSITTFSMKVEDDDKQIIRVVSMGKSAERLETLLHKSDRIVVEGRLQNAVYKSEIGEEKRGLELMLDSFEIVSGNSSSQDIVKFSDEYAGDELIGEEEIPF